LEQSQLPANAVVFLDCPPSLGTPVDSTNALLNLRRIPNKVMMHDPPKAFLET
jgi:hypothetical protein